MRTEKRRRKRQPHRQKVGEEVPREDLHGRCHAGNGSPAVGVAAAGQSVAAQQELRIDKKLYSMLKSELDCN
jgi:hypothetical protein